MLKGVDRPVAGRRLRLDRPRGHGRRRGARGRLDDRHVLRGRHRPADGGLDEALVGAAAGDDARPSPPTLVAGEYAGRAAEVTVTVRSVKEQGAARAGRRVRPDCRASSTPSTSCARTCATRLDRVKVLEQGAAGPRQGARARCWTTPRCRCRSRLVRGRDRVAPARLRAPARERRRRPGAYLERRGPDQGGVRRRAARGNAEKAVKTPVHPRRDRRRRGARRLRRRADRAHHAPGPALRDAPQEFAQQLPQGGNMPALVADVRRPRRWPRCWSGRTSPTPPAARSTSSAAAATSAGGARQQAAGRGGDAGRRASSRRPPSRRPDRPTVDPPRAAR